MYSQYWMISVSKCTAGQKEQMASYWRCVSLCVDHLQVMLVYVWLNVCMYTYSIIILSKVCTWGFNFTGKSLCMYETLYNNAYMHIYLYKTHITSSIYTTYTRY